MTTWELSTSTRLSSNRKAECLWGIGEPGRESRKIIDHDGRRAFKSEPEYLDSVEAVKPRPLCEELEAASQCTGWDRLLYFPSTYGHNLSPRNSCIHNTTRKISAQRRAITDLSIEDWDWRFPLCVAAAVAAVVTTAVTAAVTAAVNATTSITRDRFTVDKLDALNDEETVWAGSKFELVNGLYLDRVYEHLCKREVLVNT
jgi:hypothetical protein